MGKLACPSVRRALELFEVLEGRKVQFAGDSRGQVLLAAAAAAVDFAVFCGVIACLLLREPDGRRTRADDRTAAGHVFPLLARPIRFCPTILFFPSPPLSLAVSLSVRVVRDFKATKIVSYTGTRTDDGIEMASLF